MHLRRRTTSIRLFAFRTTLIWLLALALPIQGAAASTMLFCGPNHHRINQALERSLDFATERAAHGHEDSGTTASPTTRADTDPGLSGWHAEAAKAKNPFTHLGKFTCGACAACCTSVAIVSRTPFLPTLVPEDVEIAAPMLIDLPFVTDGLDRPPRPSRT